MLLTKLGILQPGGSAVMTRDIEVSLLKKTFDRRHSVHFDL